MNTLFTILKDSYREAVDGFVIYVMLGLSTLMLIGIASISFDHVPAQEVLDKSIGSMAVYVPDKGQSKAIGGVQGLQFTATDVEENGSDVQFVLTAINPIDDPLALKKSVLGWKQSPKDLTKFKIPKNRGEPGELDGEEIEFALPPNVSKAEAMAVSQEQIVEFVQQQFKSHYGVTQVDVETLDENVIVPVAVPIDPNQPDAKLNTEDHSGSKYKVVLYSPASAPGWEADLGIAFGTWSLGKMPIGITLWLIEDQLVNGVGSAITLLIGVIITAFFVPNMIRKGSLDLIIAKPISRVWLLISKYIGGCIFIFLIAVYAIGGTWFLLSLRSGYWNPNFLIAIPAITFTFALVYAISVCVGVLTRSAIAAILLSVGFMFTMYIFGKFFKERADTARTLNATESWPDWSFPLIDTINSILPRYKDLDKVTSNVTLEGNLTDIQARVVKLIIEFPDVTTTLLVTTAWIVALIGLASWRFATRDG